MLTDNDGNHLYHYACVVLSVLSLGSFSISRHIHTRWFGSSLSLMTSDAWLKSIIVLWGMWFIPWQNLFSLNWIEECLGVVVGVVLGGCVIFFRSQND